jgi:recombinational DNA repair ATPase RecF
VKLTKLDLTSFRSCADLSFDLNARRVLVAGTNGVGKSGIREGLKFALTGRCQGLDGIAT